MSEVTWMVWSGPAWHAKAWWRSAWDQTAVSQPRILILSGELDDMAIDEDVKEI